MDWEPMPTPKTGDIVTVTLPKWVKRRWWQFWRPRWTKGPLETNKYVVVEGPTSPDRNSKSQDVKQAWPRKG